MTKTTKILLLFGLIAILTAAIVISASAVSGAAFTTFNAHVDGSGKDVCKNSVINCNIYGAKEYVWLNGGPAANHLGPDGYYFFAVLEPGGQPNPNDLFVLGDKNLSDDHDAYTNRTFRTEGGEVKEYNGTHWLDSGKNGKPGEPNGSPPYIRLFPYSDTTNPGGVYILAICYLGEEFDPLSPPEGPGVEPRDCKYDAFKVKKGKLPYSFMISGIKFEDTYADGVKDASSVDPGLSGWTITIKGTGPDGNPIDDTATTGVNGGWEWYSPDYEFQGKDKPVAVDLEICEVQQIGWTQSYPATASGCYTLYFTPDVPAFDSLGDYDFGNWRPVDVTACKDRQNNDDSTTPISGWEVWLTIEGDKEGESQYTDSTGCYTWTGLTPGISYDVHEAEKPGWEPLAGVSKVWPWEDAKSGASLSYTFVNQPLEGCTPGFWQGGNGFETAGGQWLWNTVEDEDWVNAGGLGYNPYIHTTVFNAFFTPHVDLDGLTMMDLVGTGGGSVEAEKAGRSMVAAYLNASFGIGYAYNTVELHSMWTEAASSGDAALLALHTELDAANNAYYREGPPERCPISASLKN